MDASAPRHAVTDRTLDALRAAAAHLTHEDLQRRRPGKWSIAEILEHLEKTYASTGYILGRAADQGVAKGGRPTLKQRFQAWIVVGVGYFPTGVEAPEVSRPSPDPAPGVLHRAIESLLAFDAAAARAADRFGARVKVANHPILGPFTVDQWRRFHELHTRHHMRQIQGIGERQKAAGA